MLKRVMAASDGRECDVGIAGGPDSGLIFRKGEIIAKVPQERLVDALMHEIELLERGND